MTEEGVENLRKLLEVLQKSEEKQKHMTEEEKENNKIKMGDIYY